MTDDARVPKKLRQAFCAYHSMGAFATREFLFHMTDWLNDLESLHSAFSHPDDLSDEEFRKVVENFLVHAPHHIKAAHLIWEPEAMDPFAGVYGEYGILPPDEKGTLKGAIHTAPCAESDFDVQRREEEARRENRGVNKKERQEKKDGKPRKK